MKDKEEALAKAAKKYNKEEIADKAKNIIWSFVCEQWPFILIGLPFMFAGSLIDFIAPNFIGQIIDQFRA